MEKTITIEEQLRHEGYIVSTTAGYSMWPMLKNRRDRVIIRAYEPGRFPKQNDLILYRRGDGRYILHRALWVGEDFYIVRGDNTFYLEEVKPEQILGRVTEFYRKNRHCFVTSKFYRVYVWAWRVLFPLRALCHALKIGFRKLLSFAKRMIKKLIKWDERKKQE